MAFYPLVKLHQVYDGFYEVFNVAGQQIVVSCEQGKHVLFLNRCPHMGKPLTRASVQNGVLRCPSHGAEFDLPSGRGLNGAGQLHTFQAVYEGNVLGVEL